MASASSPLRRACSVFCRALCICASRKSADASSGRSGAKLLRAYVATRSPKLTVVVPLYNMERYVGRCLSSLLHAKNLTPLEVLVIDDGSKDRSIDRAREFEERFPGVVRVIAKANGETHVQVFVLPTVLFLKWENGEEHKVDMAHGAYRVPTLRFDQKEIHPQPAKMI